MFDNQYYILMAYNLVRRSLRKVFAPGKVECHPCELLAPDTRLTTTGAKAKIWIGKGVRTREGVAFRADNGRIEVGSQVFFNRHCLVASLAEVRIGDRCSFGPNVVIFDHDHRFGRNGGVGFTTAPVVIGADTWIGANVVILKGTRIGAHCVIGAGTVVHGMIPDFSLVSGSRDLNIIPLDRVKS